MCTARQRFEGFTPEGERILAWARALLAAHDGLQAEAALCKGQVVGELRLGMVPLASVDPMIFIRLLTQKYPELTYSLYSMSSAHIADGVSRNQLELLRQIQNGQQRLEMAMDYFLANRTRRFTQLHHRLQQQHPQLRLARQQTVLERLRQRMNFALDNQLKRAVSRQQRTTQRLNQQNPQPKIYRAQTRIQQLEYRLAENIRSRLSTTRERFGNAVTHLEAVSPLSTLARGYSVTTATDGKVLKQTKQVKAGDVLTTRLSDGWVESEVKEIKPMKKTRQRKSG